MIDKEEKFTIKALEDDNTTLGGHVDYLTFSLRGSLYAVEAGFVQELFWLPELTPIAEAPVYIVGVFNLWGKVVPVMDLDLRLGRKPQRYRLTDSVIVLEWAGLLMGIIVNEVHNVQPISTEYIESSPSYGREGEVRPRFIASVAKDEENIIALLDLEKLIRYSEPIGELSAEEMVSLPALERSERLFCPEATAEEKLIFRERARDLTRLKDSEDFTGLIPIAVFGLSGEYFGVDLEVVHEFWYIRNVTPIPCCPEHIIGCMNLRGNIVTLVDIRSALRMPIVGERAKGKVIVIHMDGFLAGVVVDEVFDVIHLRPSDLTALPTAVRSIKEEYLKGTAYHGAKMMTILDLLKILMDKDISVNEEV